MRQVNFRYGRELFCFQFACNCLFVFLLTSTLGYFHCPSHLPRLLVFFSLCIIHPCPLCIFSKLFFCLNSLPPYGWFNSVRALPQSSETSDYILQRKVWGKSCNLEGGLQAFALSLSIWPHWHLKGDFSWSPKALLRKYCIIFAQLSLLIIYLKYLYPTFSPMKRDAQGG